MNTNWNFAMTFPPTKDLIINLVRFADGEQRTQEELSSYAGMPGGKSSGKLRPHLDYAQSMGLIRYTYQEGKYTVTRTPLGEKIYVEDFSMDEELTLEVCNYFLSSLTIGTEVWNTIIRKSVINNTTNIPMLTKIMVLKNNKSEESISRILAPFKSAQQNYLKALRFASFENENIYVKSLPINRQNVYMYAYTLLFEWNKLCKQDTEITYDRIMNEIQWGLGFGWTEVDAFQALQLCEEYGIIKINKQLTPMTIVKNNDINYVLNHMYSLL